MKYISPVGYDNTIFQKYKFYFPNLLKYLFFPLSFHGGDSDTFLVLTEALEMYILPSLTNQE